MVCSDREVLLMAALFRQGSSMAMREVNSDRRGDVAPGMPTPSTRVPGWNPDYCPSLEFRLTRTHFYSFLLEFVFHNDQSDVCKKYLVSWSKPFPVVSNLIQD